MARVKRGTTKLRKRKKVLKQTKGFRWGRKSKERLANEALLHSFSHMFKARKEKKRNFRRLWQLKISAAAREHGMSYSKFMFALKQSNIGLDRKILADLAEHQPEIFKKIVEKVSAKENRKEEVKTAAE